MQIIAIQKTTREAPRKVRLVADVVRKLNPQDAVKQLLVVERRAGEVILKVLNSALANAQHNHNLSVDELVIKNILVNEGPRYKRFQPVSRGRAHSIVKRTSHITVILEPKKVEAKTETKIEAKAEAKVESKTETKDPKTKETVETKKAADKKVEKTRLPVQKSKKI